MADPDLERIINDLRVRREKMERQIREWLTAKRDRDESDTVEGAPDENSEQQSPG